MSSAGRVVSALRSRVARTPLYARAFPGTLILLYHRVAEVDRRGGYRLAVSAANVRAQLEALLPALRPLRLRDAAAALRAGRPLRGFAVTFDDGYADNLDVLPILEELEIPATLFVTTGFLGSQEPFAWDLELPERERGRGLTAYELARLAASPLVELGAHTVSHPRLAELPVEEQRREIAAGRDRLEQLVGAPVRGFAYPFGKLADFSAETVAVVRELGFEFACTTETGRVGRRSDPWAMPRVRAGDWDGAGLWERLERMLYLPPAKRPRAVA